MKITNLITRTALATAALAFAFAIPAGAQTIRQRQENQQDRIAQGVRSGSLTAGETAPGNA